MKIYIRRSRITNKITGVFDYGDVELRSETLVPFLVESLAQPAVKGELGDRFMEILRAIHGDVPDSFADSARLAFVHAMKEAQPAVQGEPVAWVDSLGRPQPHCVTDLKYCSVMQHKRGEHLKYVPLYAHPPSQPPREPLTLTTDQIDALFKQVSTIGEHGVPYLIASALYFRVIAYSILDAAKEKQS